MLHMPKQETKPKIPVKVLSENSKRKLLQTSQLTQKRFSHM